MQRWASSRIGAFWWRQCGNAVAVGFNEGSAGLDSVISDLAVDGRGAKSSCVRGWIRWRPQQEATQLLISHIGATMARANAQLLLAHMELMAPLIPQRAYPAPQRGGLISAVRRGCGTRFLIGGRAGC